MQTETYARRIVELGLSRDRVEVTGNLKYDAVPERLSAGVKSQLRRQLGIGDDAPVVLMGSSRPGDEALLASCIPGWLRTNPRLRLIVAPRHLNRVEEAEAAFVPWPVVRKSKLESAGAVNHERKIILLDTLGELSSLYGIADIAIVGGSFSGEFGGHNLLEPAAQGVPTLFGRDMRNFADIANALLQNGAAMQTDSVEMEKVIADLLRSPERRSELGDKAYAMVRSNAGALEKTLDCIMPLLERTLRE